MSRPPDAFVSGTNQEAWFFNGLPLQSAYGAWNIATMGGSRFGLPTFRGQNYETPYRAGQNWRAKMPDSRTITLNFWADGQGLHQTGTYPAVDPRLAFNANLAQLRAAFFQMAAGGSVQGQLQRNWYIYQSGAPKLVAATAMAEVAGSMDLTMNGRTSAAFSVDLLLADPMFYGAQQVRSCSGGASTVTGLGEGVVGLGYPSAVNSFTVTLSAPATVTNTTAGVSFAVSGGVYPVTVDVLAGTVTDSGGANLTGSLTHSGARAWMVLLNGPNTISVSSGTATFTYADAYV